MPDTQTIALAAAAFAGLAALAGVATAIIIHLGNRRQLRAYITITPSQRGNSPLVFEVEIKNCGQTPAYKLTEDFTADIRDNPFTGFPPPQNSEPDRPVYLPPGASVISAITAPTLTPQQKDDIKSGDISVYIWGEIEFIDAFNETRWVKFKGEYGKFSEAHKTGPIICPDGNDAS